MNARPQAFRLALAGGRIVSAKAQALVTARREAVAAANFIRADVALLDNDYKEIGAARLADSGVFTFSKAQHA